jgi:hypothetical protein
MTAASCGAGLHGALEDECCDKGVSAAITVTTLGDFVVGWDAPAVRCRRELASPAPPR